METRAAAEAEKRDSAWSFRRETALWHLSLKSGLSRVSEFFDGHTELPRERNRLGDRRLGRALFPGRQCLAADADSRRQCLLTERAAFSYASDSAELGEAVHVPQMVTRDDMRLSLSHISRVCLTFLKSSVTLAERRAALREQPAQWPDPELEG